MSSRVDQQWSPVVRPPGPIFNVLPKVQNCVSPWLPDRERFYHVRPPHEPICVQQGNRGFPRLVSLSALGTPMYLFGSAEIAKQKA